MVRKICRRYRKVNDMSSRIDRISIVSLFVKDLSWLFWRSLFVPNDNRMIWSQLAAIIDDT